MCEKIYVSERRAEKRGENFSKTLDNFAAIVETR